MRASRPERALRAQYPRHSRRISLIRALISRHSRPILCVSHPESAFRANIPPDIRVSRPISRTSHFPPIPRVFAPDIPRFAPNSPRVPPDIPPFAPDIPRFAQTSRRSRPISRRLRPKPPEFARSRPSDIPARAHYPPTSAINTIPLAAHIPPLRRNRAFPLDIPVIPPLSRTLRPNRHYCAAIIASNTANCTGLTKCASNPASSLRR